MADRPKILVVEDEENLARLLELELSEEGYDVVVALDGINGLSAAREHSPDLVLLDVMLPGISGLEVAARLRKSSNIPIIMLTARAESEDQVKGLDAGADDYVVKPFSIEVLLAKIRAQLRRTRPGAEGPIRYADLVLNPQTREAWRGTKRLDLSAREFDLLELFMRHPGRVWGRMEIEERVWGEYGESNVVDVYVGRLRRKLEEAGSGRLLYTVRGAGYALRERL
ncbi:MAG: response regulator transcription factor [Deinococcus sp.]|nr:response regulator transcription factor [Deinococcus sp.]